MLRKHSNSKIEEIGKAVEKWESENDCRTVCKFWDNISLADFSNPLLLEVLDPLVLKVSKEIGFSPKEIYEWYVEWFVSVSNSGDI